jgi:hypothetical protein
VLCQVVNGHYEGVAKITLSHLGVNEGYKEPVLVEGIEEEDSDD